MEQQPTHIYHEKQVARLCGVHCVNTLLQGSYFTEVDLAQFAQELDRQEKKLMMEMGTETPEFLKFMAEDSGNVDDSGDYSIQVLQQALGGMFGLKCIPVTNPEAKASLANPLKELAFICNLSNHWFTVRRIGNRWYNLNSLNEHPELLSDFYLSLYLDTLVDSGWSIFVVRGDFPPVTQSTITSEGGSWVPIELCVQKKSAPKPPKGEQDELAAAIALSLVSSSSSSSTSSSASSSTSSTASSGAKPKRSFSDVESGDDGDAELQAVLEASELEAAIAASLKPT